MQLIVNCLVPWQSGFVMLQKPRRGWWVLPGGKVEVGEAWPRAAIREVAEETGLVVAGVHLRGIHTLSIASGQDGVPTQRIIAQFVADDVQGSLWAASREGKLAIVKEQDVLQLPMNEGDRVMLLHTLAAEQKQENTIYFGMFTYQTNDDMRTWTMEPGARVNA